MVMAAASCSKLRSPPKRGLRLLALTLSVIFLAQAAATENLPKSDPWERFCFEGNQTFTPDQLRKSLVAEPDFLLANHPKGQRDDVHAAIVRLLTAGYLRAGFPNSQVKATTNEAGVTTVQIVEGPRYRCGRVFVRGTQQIDAVALAEFLTTPQVAEEAFPVFVESGGRRVTNWTDEKGGRVHPSKPCWQPDAPVPFGTEKSLESHVNTALKAQGFSAAKFTVQIETLEASEQAHLIVEFVQEGTPDQIGKIEVTGCETNRPEQVIAYLQLAVGQRFDSERLQRLAEQLWSSGRFTKSKIRLERYENEAATLHLELTETPRVPPLDEPLSEAAETLLLTRQWLSQCEVRGDDLIFQIRNQVAEVTLVQSTEGTLLQLLTLPVAAPIAASEEASDDLQETETPASELTSTQSSSIVIDSKRIHFELADAVDYWSADISKYPGNLGCQLALEADQEEDKFTRLTVGFNFRSERLPGTSMLTTALSLSPAGWCALAYKPKTHIEVKQDVMVLTHADQTMEIERRSGRLIRFESEGTRTLIRPGAFQSMRRQVLERCLHKQNMHDAAKPCSSLVEYLLAPSAVELYERLWPAAETNQATMNRARWSALRRLTHAGLLHPIDVLLIHGKSEAGSPKNKFEIPGDQGPPSSVANMVAKVVAREVLKWLPSVIEEDTWPMQISREACLVVLNRSQYTESVLTDLAKDPTGGPLRDSALAALLSFVKVPVAQYFAAQALKKLEPVAFDRDLQTLLSGPPGNWLNELMRGVGELNEHEFASLLVLVKSEETKTMLKMIHARAKAEPEAGSLWYQATHENLRQQLRGLMQR